MILSSISTVAWVPATVIQSVSVCTDNVIIVYIYVRTEQEIYVMFIGRVRSV